VDGYRGLRRLGNFDKIIARSTAFTYHLHRLLARKHAWPPLYFGKNTDVNGSSNIGQIV